MKINEFLPSYCRRIPVKLEEGVLYVCLDCNVVIHLCPCGCGEKIVIPLGKGDACWQFKFDNGCSLFPSIGNYQIPCKSHYYITNNKVKWCK